VKTDFEQVDILYDDLVSAGIKNQISGDVYKYKIPAGESDKENIVVNSLPVTIGQLQNGTANVNIHVPNIHISDNGIEDSVPNNTRLKELTDFVVNALLQKFGSGYSYFIQQQNIIEDIGNYFSNIRVEFVFINVN
jgi:hypothetical protein